MVDWKFSFHIYTWPIYPVNVYREDFRIKGPNGKCSPQINRTLPNLKFIAQSLNSPIRPSIIMSFHAVIIFGGIFYEPVKCIFKPHEDKKLGALMQHYLSCLVYPSVCFSLCKSCHICGMQIHLHVYWKRFQAY